MEICDVRTGLCGPLQEPEEEVIQLASSFRAEILLVTDPYCSHCWGQEPAWRKFAFLYGSSFTLRYIYGGLLPSWDGFSRGGITSAADLVPHFAEVAEHYGQPIDTTIQITDPPYSSYPPSIAIHLVRAWEPAREEAYLRRIRQALFLESRNFTRPEVLADCAVDVGLNRQQFLAYYQEGRGRSAFQHDLQEAHQLGALGFPTIFIKTAQNNTLVLRGGQSFERLEQAFLKITGLERVSSQKSVWEILRAYGSGTTREFSEILGLGHTETIQALIQADARRTPLAGDALWSSI